MNFCMNARKMVHVQKRWMQDYAANALMCMHAFRMDGSSVSTGEPAEQNAIQCEHVFLSD